MSSLCSKATNHFFFVYGYGGIGKTFLWNALISVLRAAGEIVLTVASSGIVATLLPSGRTAHSRFAILIQITKESVCHIKQNSPFACLIQCTKLIIWDEAPMVQSYCIEAFNRTLRDIMHSNRPFGGKCVVMGGDFRQILLVIPKGIRVIIVDACISSSHLWDYCKSIEDSDSFDDLYTTEFLNMVTCSGLPPHKLTLKVGAPVMLMRNIDQASGLCNETRLRITQLGKSVIEGIILNGSNQNDKVLIHMMDINPSESRWPFKMKRRQFPVSLSFAMIINKSQGQSLHHVRLYLTKLVFTHGQLYVALSRVKDMNGLKILLHGDDCHQKSSITNVVCREIFQKLLLV
ncbi:ATP-dependent DNA helicase RRM3-like [Prosopis cineraria]|uniref:ATP-dependent DNA helicase RRM3-like n=1 Tax=Prosopis cineraria TaxID=364024 RepID=UPI0024105D4C|nr:ATP-dependent DNA helicase RRM3-like [Prosopis cineraria]